MKTNFRNTFIRVLYWVVLAVVVAACAIKAPIYWAQKGGLVLARAGKLCNNVPIDSNALTEGANGAPLWSEFWASVNGYAARVFGESIYQVFCALGLLALVGLFYLLYRKSELRLFRPEQAILMLLFCTPLFGYFQLFNPIWLVSIVALAALLLQARMFSGNIISGVFGGVLVGGMAAYCGGVWIGTIAGGEPAESYYGAGMLAFCVSMGGSGFWTGQKKLGWFLAEILIVIGIVYGIWDLPKQALMQGVGGSFYNLLLQFASGGTGVPTVVYWLLALPCLAAVLVGAISKEFKSFLQLKVFIAFAAVCAWMQLIIWLYLNTVPELNLIFTQGLLLANPVFIGFWLNWRAFGNEGGQWRSWAIVAMGTVLITPILSRADYSLIFGSWQYVAIIPLLMILGWRGIVKSFSGKTALMIIVLLTGLALAMQAQNLKMAYGLDKEAQRMQNELMQASKDADIIVTDAFFIPELTPRLDKPIFTINSPAACVQYAKFLEKNPSLSALVVSPTNRDYGFLWKLGMPRSDKVLEFNRAPSWGLSVSLYKPNSK